jgi:hypothetical protein
MACAARTLLATQIISKIEFPVCFIELKISFL